MRINIAEVFIWLIPLIVSIYTLSYGVWLWRKKQIWSAFGVLVLAIITALYPGYVLFFIHR